MSQAELKPDEFYISANGQPAVELWVHIPEGAENIDRKWKEERTDSARAVQVGVAARWRKTREDNMGPERE